MGFFIPFCTFELVRKVLICSFVLFSLMKNVVSASDIMGADITYRCLGNDSFEFTTVVYKDCNANWTIPANIYNLNVAAIGCSFNAITAYPQLVSCKDITPVCVSSCSKCTNSCNASTSNSNCTFPYGIEKLVFKTIIYLGNTNCCTFRVGYIGNSTRNFATTTCCNSDLFYTYVEFNKCVKPCNNSPVLSNDPVGILCANQDFTFNSGALDTLDGDSISYELAPALASANQTASYFNSFTYLRPLTFWGFPNTGLSLPLGFHLNAVSGDLSFRPTQANQVAVVVIKVKEWRRINGVMVAISETRRDMQLIVINCNNQVPKINGPFSFEACAGQQICVDITTADSNANDTVTISWNAGISGATFTNNNRSVKWASGRVCWTPQESQISNLPYSFTIKAQDNACPFKGEVTKSYSIFVREIPKAQRQIQTLPCGKVGLNYSLQRSIQGLNTSWAIRNDKNNTVWSSNKKTDTAELRPGKHAVFLTLRTPVPCIVLSIDTVIVLPYLQASIPEINNFCQDAEFNLNPTISGGENPLDFVWSEIIDSANHVQISTQRNLIFKPDSQKRIGFFVKDAKGCMVSDTFDLISLKKPPLSLGPDKSICEGFTIAIDGRNDTMSLSYLWNSGDTTSKINISKTGVYTLQVKDSNQCKNTDTILIEVNQLRPEAGEDVVVCEDDTVTLSGMGAGRYEWHNLIGFSLNPMPLPLDTNQIYKFVAKKNTTFLLRGMLAFDGKICENYDTVKMTVKPKPELMFRNIGPFCPDVEEINLNNALLNRDFVSLIWSASNPNWVKDSLFRVKFAGPNQNLGHQITARIQGNNGCSNEKVLAVRVFFAPPNQLRDSFWVCSNSGILNLNTLRIIPGSTFGTIPEWFDVNKDPLFSNSINKSNIHNQTLDVNIFKPGSVFQVVSSITNANTGCVSFDTAILNIRELPKPELGKIPNLCRGAMPINLNEVSKPKPLGGLWKVNGNSLSNGVFIPGQFGGQIIFQDEQIQFEYTVNDGFCSNSVSSFSLLYGLPKITLSRFDSICSSNSTLDLKPLAQPQGGVWNRNGLEANTLDLGSLVNQKVTVMYTYQNPINLCQNSDSLTFLVQAQPEIYLSVPDKNCEGENIGIASSFNNANGMVWSTAGDGVFDDSLLGLSTTILALTKYWYGQQDFNTTYFNLLAQTTGNGVCEAAQANQRVNVFLKPKLQLSTDINEGCEPLTVNFKLQYQTDSLPTFYWNFGNGVNITNRNILQDFSYTYLNAGNYLHSVLVVTDSSRGACKTQTEPLAVNVYPKPKAAINASKWLTNVADTEIQFYDKSSVASPGFLTEWFWQFGDKLGGYATIQNPIYYYNVQNESDTGDYIVSLQVKTNHDCKDTAENVLTIKPDITVYIPNSFTPNRIGPSRNNQFFVVAQSYDAINIKIFNRWGEKLYESTDANEGWDGTYMGNNVPDGVYVYLVEAEAWGKKYRYYGTITLLR